MDLQELLFLLIATFTGLSAIAVLISQNIVRSAVWLLFTLAGTSGVFFLLGADFVAATQLIIYVGGILVLVVFGVMLTAQGPFITMKVGAAEWIIATVVGVLLLGVLSITAVQAVNRESLPDQPSQSMKDPEHSMSSAELALAFLGIKEITPRKNLSGVGRASSRTPERRQVAYLLPFEIVSVHLLVVLIGAAYLARAKRRRGVVT
jgi:NADH:ubiquinone oxidoreductase subunit 6 (subunit J)